MALRILVADDELMYRELFQAALERLGHSCVVVEDGREALRALQDASFDVVLADWLLPSVPGADLCQQVRAFRGRPYTIVMLLTDASDPELFQAGLEAGADDLVAKPVSDLELELRLFAAGRVIDVHRQLEERSRELEVAYEQLRETARVDALTGVANRRALDEDLLTLVAEIDRYGRHYCVALADIDHFKAFNDTYGHQAGDDCLARVGGALRSTMRRGDRVYRYGGEEFLLVFPEQPLARGELAAERMAASVRALGIRHDGSDHGLVTLSMGVAALASSRDRSARDSLKAADDALYAAKGAGRNCVKSSAGDDRYLARAVYNADQADRIRGLLARADAEGSSDDEAGR